MIVRDQHGDPVTDLKPADFTVFDNGQSQTISVFHLDVSQPPGTVRPLPLNTFSNLPKQESGAMPSATVILLDALNTAPSDQQNARNQVMQFIRRLRSGDRVALFALDSQLHVLQDFTGDAQALLASLARYKGYLSPQLAASTPAPVGAANPLASMGSSIQITLPPQASASAGQIPPMGAGDAQGDNELANYQRSLEDLRERQADLYISDRVRRTANALGAIAERVAAYPGRKNLVWVSGGFPYWVGMETTLQRGRLQPDEVSFAPEIRATARTLSDMDLAIYPVDARGLMVSSTYDPASEGIPSPQSLTMAGAKSTSDLHATMDELASLTGGRAFYNTNDIGGAVRRAIDDSRVTYLLGYYPQNVKWNGQFRTIRIKVDRPRLKLQYRKAYTAFPGELASAQNLRSALLDALYGPLPATAVGLTAHAAWESSPGGTARLLDLQIHVRSSDVTWQAADDRWTASLSVATAALSPTGSILNVGSETFTLRLTPETRDKVLAAGLTLKARVQAPQNTDLLRIVVHDDLSGALGSITIPLDRVVSASAVQK